MESGRGNCKSVIIGGWLIVKLSNPSCLLDIDLVTWIEVFTVCTNGLIPDMFPS